jgi:hypothetical protein
VWLCVIFLDEPVSKKCGNYIHFMFGGLFGVSQMVAEYGLRSTLADFLSNKSELPNRKKGFYTSHLPKNEEIGGIFVFSGSKP